MKAAHRALALLAVGTIALIGCGGGSSKTSSSNSTPSSTASPAASSPSGAQSASPSGGGLNGIGDIATCARAAAAYGQAVAAAAQAVTGGSTQLDSAVQQLKDFEGRVPSDIKSDMDTVVQAYANFLKAIQDSGYSGTSGQPPTADQAQKLQDAQSQLEDPTFQDAANRVSSWFQSNCT